MNRIAATGSRATTEVLIDRTRVWLTARFTDWTKVRCDSWLVFSRTLSNTTTVSYSEYPRIVRKPMTAAGVTSSPTMPYTPAVMSRSCSSATMAETDIFHVRKYSAMTTAASTRKITSPRIAWASTSAPHVAPMYVEATWSSETSYAFARASCTWVVSRSVSCSVWTRMPSWPTCETRGMPSARSTRRSASRSTGRSTRVRDRELGAAGELDAELVPAAEPRHGEGHHDRDDRDEVPRLASADDVVRALARVEVAAELAEAGHQSSFPSGVVPSCAPEACWAFRSAIVWRRWASPALRWRLPSTTGARNCARPR